MKIEIERLIIENGQPKEIKLLGEVYLLHLKTQENTSTALFMTTTPLDKGQVVCRRGHTKLYENVANEVRQIINQPKIVILKTVKKYYPLYKESSLQSITSLYINFVNGKYPITTTAQLQRICKRRHRKRKPQGAIAYENTYHLWIKPENIQKVKLGVNKFGIDYKPNAKTLKIETGLPENILLSTLKYMMKQGMIIRKRTKDSDGKSFIYQPVVRIGEQ